MLRLKPTTIAAIAVSALALGGCATKDYVNQQMSSVDAKDELRNQSLPGARVVQPCDQAIISRRQIGGQWQGVADCDGPVGQPG